MDLLPKHHSDFLSKSYWDSFFRKLSQKSSKEEYFEWYGEASSYFPLILSNLIETSEILNVGCGNSLFSEELYDKGFKYIKNIDFSNNVIKKMKKRNKKRGEMNWVVMDVFEMTFEKESFDAIIDKGTLDAIYPEEKKENREKIEKYFNKIVEILKINGSYYIISLLQEHILTIILEFFKGFDIEINEILISNSKLFPFLITLKKTDKSNLSLSLIGKEKIIGISIENCVEMIKKTQLQNNFAKNSKKLREKQRFMIEIWEKKGGNIPKYTLIVVDSPTKNILEKKTCAVFITPQGKENGYLFSEERGNYELLQQTQLSRLIIVILNPGHDFKSMKEIQNEINSAAVDLIPINCTNFPCPFLTDGDELGERLTIYQDSNLIIEECKIEDDVYRRLLLKSNLLQIQSQFKLTLVPSLPSNKSKNNNIPSLLPIKENYDISIDQSYLDFECHRLMVLGLLLLENFAVEVEKQKILVLGGGLCALSNFIYHHFKEVNIETVEISGEIIKLAISTFGVETTSDFKLIEENALNYLNFLERNEETKSSDAYDYIILDINSANDYETSPPLQFLQKEFLTKIEKNLKKGGIFALNFLSHQPKELDITIETLSQYFGLIYTGRVEKELNKVIFGKKVELLKEKKKNFDNTEAEIVLIPEDQIIDTKKMENLYKNLNKKLKKNWDATMNLEGMISGFELAWPKYSKSPFEKNDVEIVGQGDNKTNNTKEMYLKDMQKVQKNKKKKNKKR